jgi:hypothetical protein
MPQIIPYKQRNIAEIFSRAFGRIGVISVRYDLPFSDLVISHLRLCAVVLCLFVLLQNRRNGGDRTFRLLAFFLALYVEVIWDMQNYLRVPPCKRRL